MKKFFAHLVLLTGALVTLGPFVWMFSTSLQNVEQVLLSQHRLQLLPQPATFFSYAFIMGSQFEFPRFIFNSVIVSVAVVVGQVVIAAMAGYAFARLKFPGKNIIFIIFLSAMMIPTQVTMVGRFLVVKELGWVDKYASLIVPNMASVFGIFLLRQFFMSIPKDFDEAAIIDGASFWQVFVRIVMPLAKPAVSALVIFSFIGIWNDFMWPLIVTNSAHMRTLQIGLSYFIDSGGGFGAPEGGNWNVLSAGAALAVIPTLIVFLSAQKQFVEGIVLTGIKG